jgi:hypothetical protein
MSANSEMLIILEEQQEYDNYICNLSEKTFVNNLIYMRDGR